MRRIWVLMFPVVILCLAGCGDDSCSPCEDSVPPGPITDLSAYVFNSTVRVSWTNPGDDGPYGSVAEVDIRLTADWETGFDWNEAQPLDLAPANLNQGTQGWVELHLERGADYSFSVRCADESGNWSAWADAAHCRTGPPLDREFTRSGDLGTIAAMCATDSLLILYGNHDELQKYNLDGELLGSWNVSSNSSCDVAIDDHLNIYVATDSKVYKYNDEGELIDEWGDGIDGVTFDRANSIAIRSAGEAFVMDRSGVIQVFDAAGQPTDSWIVETGYTGNGTIAIGPDDDTIFVHAGNNSEVQMFSSQGEFLGVISLEMDDPEESIWNIEVDSSGDFIFTGGRPGEYLSYICRYTGEGDLVTRWSLEFASLVWDKCSTGSGLLATIATDNFTEKHVEFFRLHPEQ